MTDENNEKAAKRFTKTNKDEKKEQKGGKINT